MGGARNGRSGGWTRRVGQSDFICYFRCLSICASEPVYEIDRRTMESVHEWAVGLCAATSSVLDLLPILNKPARHNLHALSLRD